MTGVSVVIPVHNGARWLPRVIAAIRSQDYQGPVEIIAVDDASSDESPEVLRQLAGKGLIRLLHVERRGACAAINLGIRQAHHSLIAQIDQDVIIGREWLRVLAGALGESGVAAAQGHYVAGPDADIWSRVMALDLRQRYAALRLPFTDHVCTGNSVYRASALHEIGLFDESLGYGYDNDVSYRLTGAGHRLVMCPAATSIHVWRSGLRGYLRQQYGFGYGRLDLLARHRSHLGGDDVSPSLMMAHAPVTLTACLLLATAATLAVMRHPWTWAALLGGGLLAALALERTIAGINAAVRFRDAAGLWFAPVHMFRNFAWAAAVIAWTARRLLGRQARPAHSMSPRAPHRNTTPSHD